MAVSAQEPKNVSIAAAGATEFPFAFKVISKNDLYVTVDGNEKTVDVDFTIDGVGADAGGNITFGTPMVGGERVLRMRDMAFSRDTDYQNLGDLRSATLNNDQDAPILMIQQLAADVALGLALPPDSIGVSNVLPEPTPLALLGWNSGGTQLENFTPETFLAGITAGATYTFPVSAGATSVNIATIPAGYAVQAVFYNGIYQEPGAFSVVGTSLIPGEALPAAGVIAVQVILTTAEQISDAADLNVTALGTGAATRSIRSKLGERVSVLDFIPPNLHAGILARTDTTDLAPYIQAAIDSFPAAGGALYVPQGLYNLASTVWLSGPVLLRGDGWGDETVSVNGSGDGCTEFHWNGANGDTMFFMCADTEANVLAGTGNGKLIIGGGIVDCLLDGRKDAATFCTNAVWAASTSRAQFRVLLRCFTGVGLIFDGANGVLSSRNDVYFHMVYGVAAETPAMIGAHFRRTNAYPSTQNRITLASGLVYDGDLLLFQDTDNNLVWHVHGVTQAGGVGRAISFRNGVTASARNNVVYYVNGDVSAESNTFGNRIDSHDSEGSFISIAAGGQLHYTTRDYVTAELHQSHRFALSDELRVSAGELMAVSLATASVSNALWPAWMLADAATQSVGACLRAPYHWNDGTITALKVNFAMSGATAGQSVRLRIRLITVNAGAINTAETDQSFTVPAAAASTSNADATLTLTTPLAYAKGDAVLLNIERVGADAADTAAANMLLLGASLVYVGAGPNSPGSGPFDVGPTGL